MRKYARYGARDGNLIHGRGPADERLALAIAVEDAVRARHAIASISFCERVMEIDAEPGGLGRAFTMTRPRSSRAL